MSDLIILIDTREQSPFQFKNTGVLCCTQKLDTGDYAVKGFESEICIERKSVPDFLGSISHDRERFAAELERMRPYARKYVVVEGPLSSCMQPVTVRKGPRPPKIKGKVFPQNKTIGVYPDAVFGSVIAIGVKYGVQFFFAEDRKQAEDFTLRTLRKFWEYKRKGCI